MTLSVSAAVTITLVQLATLREGLIAFCTDGQIVAGVTRTTCQRIGLDVSMYPEGIDCNSNGLDDGCDLACGPPQGACDLPGCGMSGDCNSTGRPDECDIGDGKSNDCQTNGIPDECDIARGSSEDCQPNGIPDECDGGCGQDCNKNGTPDNLDICSDDRNGGRGVGVPFVFGDVFAAVGNGMVQHYDDAGNLLDTYNTELGGFTTGMAFDSAGRLYLTNFSANSVSRFDGPAAPHTNLGPFGTGYSGSPESVLFDGAGNVYVGAVDGDDDIRKFAADGTPLAQFNVLTEDRGSDWIDLAGDQSTMFYTSEGNRVFRYDVQTSTQLADFNQAPLPGSNAFALRILPSGDVLVADRESIVRLNSSGAQIQTYDVDGENNWFALNLDPNGTSFWSGAFGTANFYKLNIATGAVELGPINTGSGFNTLFGLSVFGEITAGVENCFNGIDDDGDKLVDCADSNCALAPNCTAQCSPDCNRNAVPDECELAGSDCNANGMLDECEGVTCNLITAISRKANLAAPGVCGLPIDLDLGNALITSEMRVDADDVSLTRGITQLVLTYAGSPASTAVMIEEDASCPSPPSYGPYTGASMISATVQGNDLVLTFTPGLENARTYRLTVPHGAGTTQAEIRGLIGDTNSDGRVNGTDRSGVVGIWTGGLGFSCTTDINNDGRTNAADRSLAVGAWTSAARNCAP